MTMLTFYGIWIDGKARLEGKGRVYVNLNSLLHLLVICFVCLHASVSLDAAASCIQVWFVYHSFPECGFEGMAV